MAELFLKFLKFKAPNLKVYENPTDLCHFVLVKELKLVGTDQHVISKQFEQLKKLIFPQKSVEKKLSD